MTFPLPLRLPTAAEAAADREREFDRDHPERETLWLAAAGAAWTLGPDHSATRALTKASITMAKVDTCGTPGWRSGPCGSTSARPSRRRRKG